MTKKLTDVALSDRVYSAMREDLIAGHYKPGEKITISSLAKKFEISPTPIREAVRLLLAQGALELKTNHSVTVVDLTASEYREIAKIRLELEGMAAAEAANLRTDKQLAKLIQTNKKLEAARKKKKFSDVLQQNRAFHFAMAEMANMPTLASVLEILWMRSGPILNVLYKYGYQSTIDDHPHDELILAIKKRDPVAAATAMRRDIKLGTEIIAAHLESLEAKRAVEANS